jgi:hypothetical protein
VTASGDGYQFAGRRAGPTLGVEGVLKQQRSSSLVDHGTPLLGVAAALAERRMCHHGRETLVHEPDLDRIGQLRERCGKVSCVAGSLSSTSGQAGRQADDNLDYTPIIRQAHDLSEVTVAAPHGHQRGSQQRIRIAARDADPHRSDVNAKPDA